MVNALTTSISREPNCDGPAVIRDDYLTSTPAVRFAQTAVIRRRRGDKGPWQDPVRVPSRQWRRAGRGPGRARAIREMVALRAQGKALRSIAAALAAQGHRISHESVGAP